MRLGSLEIISETDASERFYCFIFDEIVPKTRWKNTANVSFSQLSEQQDAESRRGIYMYHKIRTEDMGGTLYFEAIGSELPSQSSLHAWNGIVIFILFH
jgi:hypothetical protein